MVLDTIEVGQYPRAFAHNPQQNRTYIANHMSSNISVIRDVTGIHESLITINQAHIVNIVPNPFTKNAIIEFQGSVNQRIELNIYDRAGRLQRVLSLPAQSSKKLSRVIWDGRDNTGNNLPNGVYFVRLELEDYCATGKLLLIR